MKLFRKSKWYLLLSLSSILIILLVILFFSNKTLRFLFKDKVWAHKVNSIEKLNAAKIYYTGVELDVVYFDEKNYFDVNHPPDKSIDLSLKEYFKSQSNNENYGYWIDFKNLNAKNELIAANKLDSIIALYKFNQGNVVVESLNPQFLNSFLKRGFLTSYYLPPKLYTLNKDSLDDLIIKIKNEMANYNTTYISTDYKDYKIIKEHFPNHKKLIWFVTCNSQNKFLSRLLLYEILLDDKVDVLLIPFFPK